MTLPATNNQLVYIALGANLAEPLTRLKRSVRAISQLKAVKLIKQSSYYLSAPVESNGPDYINAVIAIETSLNPFELLEQLQQLEQQAGRLRPYKNAPRTLDLDIILFAEQSINTPQLTIPHPRWQQRAFVLLPLQEIAPHLVTVEQLAAVSEQQIKKL